MSLITKLLAFSGTLIKNFKAKFVSVVFIWMSFIVNKQINNLGIQWVICLEVLLPNRSKSGEKKTCWFVFISDYFSDIAQNIIVINTFGILWNMPILQSPLFCRPPQKWDVMLITTVFVVVVVVVIISSVCVVCLQIFRYAIMAKLEILSTGSQ